MKRTLISISIALTTTCFAQVDTIFSNNEKIPCLVKEITQDAVKYSFLNEEVTTTMYKNVVQKIVFKSGRVQTFAEATAFKKVENVQDYGNVTISRVESEVKGLYKLGDVSSKAKGTTTISNQERVKERAYRKLKIQAAMQGGNSVYLTNQRTNGNLWGGYFQSGTTAETDLTGVVYATELPDFNEFEKRISGKRIFRAEQLTSLYSCFSDMTHERIRRELYISDVRNENGLIILEGRLECVPNYSQFRVVSFTSDSFTIFYEDKSAQHNVVIKF